MAAPLPPSNPTPASPPKAFSSQALLAVSAVGLFAFLAWKAYSPQFTARPTDKVIVAGKPVDLNTADRAELLQIPGVGPATAEAILAYRKQHGRYETLDELDHVHGIGAKTLDKLRPWLTVGPGVNAFIGESVEKLERKPAALPAMTSTTSPKVTPGNGTININTASVDDLVKLPAIGTKLADRILAERKTKPFQSLEDLKRVGGIGVKTMEKLKPLIRFND